MAEPWDYSGRRVSDIGGLLTSANYNPGAFVVDESNPYGRESDLLWGARQPWLPQQSVADQISGGPGYDATGDYRAGLPAGWADVTVDPTNGIAWGVDSQGTIIPGSNYSVRTNDDATFIAGALGILGAGAYAGAAGGGAAGAGEAGSAGASGIAPLEAGAAAIPEVAAGPGAAVGGGVTAGQVGAGATAANTVGENYGDNSASNPQGPGTTGGAGAGGGFSDLQQWMRDNPNAGRVIAGLLGGALTQTGGGGGSGGGGGYQDSGYRPTITRGGWSPSVQARTSQAPMLGMSPGLLGSMGGQNDGLWRYRGLLGGGG